MSTLPKSNPNELNDLTARIPAGANWSDPAQPPGRWARARRSPIVLFGLIFLVGLLAGWLVLGIFMWRTGSSSSGQFPPAYERMYMTWVADRYAESGSVTKVRQDLILWSREDTLRVLVTLQTETTNPEAKRRLVMLAGALDVSVPSNSAATSTRPSFFAQPAFLASMFLAVGLLLGAIGIIVVPMLRERTGTAEELTGPPPDSIDANLEELLADVQIGTLDAEPEKKPEEKEAVPPPEDKEQESADSGLGDLASLFEDEDTSLTTLEAFCKGLTEVNIDELAGLGNRVVERFRTSKPMPAKG